MNPNQIDHDRLFKELLERLIARSVGVSDATTGFRALKTDHVDLLADDRAFGGCCGFFRRPAKPSRNFSQVSRRVTLPPKPGSPAPIKDKFAVVADLVEKFSHRYEVISVDEARVLFGDGWG